MFLALDVGNTQTTIALLDPKESQAETLRRWRIQTNEHDTADELAMHLKALLSLGPFSLDEIGDVAVSCVVPTLLHAWKTAFQRLGKKAYFIEATDFLNTGLIAPDIAAPETIGADRLANVAEAKYRYGFPAIIVDFGTATNIEVLDARGFFVGGSISPGLIVSANALFKNAAKLADVPIVSPAHAIGTTSEENIQAGLVLGWASMIEGLVKRMKKELQDTSPAAEKPFSCAVVGTGGLMSIMNEATDCFTDVDPDLTLRGIYRLYTLLPRHS